jgi:diguanylate cyclase (GGDEF)-like protein/PAS domain S-box-containing protein
MRSRPDKKPEAEIIRFERSGALLRKIMENAAVGMALVGLDHRLLYVNGAFAGMLGTEPDALAGSAIGDLVHPDCDAAALFHLDRLFEGEADDHRAEWRLRHDDGGAVWVLASASVLHSDSTGRPLYVILQVTNIDRQKRAEAALAYSESRWSFALAAAGQGVWDHDIRTDDMFYSDTWRTMRGIPNGEYVDPAQDEWLKRVHPDDVPKILSTVEKQDAGEEGFDTLEYRERHRDGHWLWILSRGRPVEWDAAGKPVRSIGTDTDITRLKTVEAELAEEKERLRVTLQSIADGVISTDAEARITFMNPLAEEMTGWSSAEAMGRPLQRVFEIVEESTGKPARSPVLRCITEGRHAYLDADVLLVARVGAKRDIRSSAAPLRAPEGDIIGAVLVFQDVTDSRALQRQLAHSATHDTLTGLPNRLAFERALITVADQAKREMRQHALCFIDLDHFKPVNDRSGHAAGDALLRQVAELIRNVCRRQDFAARIGGDEFALLMSDCPLSAARRVAQKIVDSVAAIEFCWHGQTHRIGASVGVTQIAAGSAQPAELMAEADAACYVAKASGRGRVEVYGVQKADDVA